MLNGFIKVVYVYFREVQFATKISGTIFFSLSLLEFTFVVNVTSDFTELFRFFFIILYGIPLFLQSPYTAATAITLRFISSRTCGGPKHSHFSPKPRSI